MLSGVFFVLLLHLVHHCTIFILHLFSVLIMNYLIDYFLIPCCLSFLPLHHASYFRRFLPKIETQMIDKNKSSPPLRCLFLTYRHLGSPTSPLLIPITPPLSRPALSFTFSFNRRHDSVSSICQCHMTDSRPHKCARALTHTDRHRHPHTHTLWSWDRLGADDDESGLEKCHRGLS